MRRRWGALVCFFRGCPLELREAREGYLWHCPRCGREEWHPKWRERGI